MHLEIRTINGRKAYYLAHSYRQGQKVLKARVYLGGNLHKQELNTKMESGRAELSRKLIEINTIKDPYNTVLSDSELKELKTLVPIGRIRLSHISERQWLRFTESFTYHTNAIEGSTVTEKEVTNILDNDIWPDKSKEEISETQGVAKAVEYIRKNKEHLSIQLVTELHNIIFRNSKSFAGSLRKRGVEVAVVDNAGKIIHRGAPSGKVSPMLKDLVKWYGNNSAIYPPLVLAAVVHNQFEIIHPFQDGNGRIGRLLLINVLMKHNLPPVNIELSNRKEYYDAILAYQKESNIRPMIELILKEYRKLRGILK